MVDVVVMVVVMIVMVMSVKVLNYDHVCSKRETVVIYIGGRGCLRKCSSPRWIDGSRSLVAAIESLCVSLSLSPSDHDEEDRSTHNNPITGISPGFTTYHCARVVA